MRNLSCATIATVVLLLVPQPELSAQQAGTAQSAAWLDVPASWVRSLENGRVLLVPGDLRRGTSLRFWVEPPTVSSEPLDAAYQRTIAEIGTWRPIREPVDQVFESGWQFRFGNGVVETGGQRFTALVAVARRNDRVARFWVLASDDDTYNSHSPALMTGISSVQDTDPRPAVASPGSAKERGAAPPAQTAVAVTAIDPAFGEGVTGAYLGLERGLRASAGAGGQELILDLATNFLSIGSAPGSPQLRTTVQDYPEVDVFFPDGSYRRGLPVRGLAADLGWDRARRPGAWGTWKVEGGRIVTQRSDYTASYGIDGDRLVSERDRPWRKLPPLTDTRIDGTFARADYRDPAAPRLVLRADGTYEERGNFLHMVGSAWNLVIPDGEAMVSQWTDAQADRAMSAGSGTYTLDRYTLTFRDRNGRVWQFNACIPPTATVAGTGYLVMNGYTLRRD
jgi:hypothetical protein